jgi:hypothetical protein
MSRCGRLAHALASLALVTTVGCTKIVTKRLEGNATIDAGTDAGASDAAPAQGDAGAPDAAPAQGDASTWSDAGGEGDAGAPLPSR